MENCNLIYKVGTKLNEIEWLKLFKTAWNNITSSQLLFKKWCFNEIFQTNIEATNLGYPPVPFTLSCSFDIEKLSRSCLSPTVS